MLIPKYRKLPVEIEAVRYMHHTRDGIIEWIEANGGDVWHRGSDDDGAIHEMAHLFISTLEGEMMVEFGTYVVRGTAGEFYPVKAEIFATTFELVE